MIGGGSGRSAGAFAAAGALATTGAFATLGASGARAVSGARGEASPLTRRRSIAARARSLASRRSSRAAAVATGAAGAAAVTGAAEEFMGEEVTGCTGDGSMTLIFSLSRGAAAWRRWSASAELSTDFASDLESADLVSVDLESADLVSGLASAFASALASVFSWAFSTTAGRSAAVFSIMDFSEIPLALTPAAGRLLTLAVDRKSTRLNSSHTVISYAVFCLKNK